MPVTLWKDVPRGQLCEMPTGLNTSCENYATHYYGVHWYCCNCHGGCIVSQEDARVYHEGTAKEFKAYWNHEVLGYPCQQ